MSHVAQALTEDHMNSNVENHTPPTHLDHEFRFETFFMGQLVNSNVVDPSANVDTRFRLLISAIHKGERAGYYVDGNLEDYDAVTPARRCNNIDAISSDARVLLMDGLFGNGYLDEQSWMQWRDVATRFNLNDYAPTLLNQVTKRHKTIDATRAFELLNQCFLATAPQLFNSEIELIRRERPRDLIAQVAAIPFGANVSRALARESLFMGVLHREGMLTDDQIVAIFDTNYRRVTGYRGTTDLSHDGGAVITNALTKAPGKVRATIWQDTVRRVGGVGVFGPETPWGTGCSKPNPPKVCALAQRYPVAAAFTTALIEHKQWDKTRAANAWDRIAMVLPD